MIHHAFAFVNYNFTKNVKNYTKRKEEQRRHCRQPAVVGGPGAALRQIQAALYDKEKT